MIKWYQRRKLIHQIGAVILIGFGTSFFLSLYLLSSETSKNLNFLSSFSAIQRVISVVEILTQTPPALHASIIQASAGSDLALSLSSKPRVSVNHKQTRETTQLTQRLNAAGIDNIYLSLVKKARPISNMNNMHSAMRGGAAMREMREHHRVGYIATIEGSVELRTGSWLNFSSGVEEKITHWSTGLILSLTLVMLTTIILSLLIVRRALTPIRDLGTAANLFAQNKEVTPVSSECPQDLRPTITAFNAMQRTLSDYIHERTKLLAAISHDLRTPLTSLRLRLEFIEESEDKQQMLATILNMEKMLQATMRFAKEDSHREERQCIDINSLMLTIVDEYADKNIAIMYHETEKLVENVPPLSIRRMIENLVNNSVQYGGDVNTISLRVSKEKDDLVISIADTGIGIDEDKFEDVVKPFTRLDKARDTATSNVGLGLSITKSLANAYGGELILEKNQPTGLICKCSIKLVDS